ncbi:MAG: proton-conducting transporter membrane subunit [Gemmataceae bacterium]
MPNFTERPGLLFVLATLLPLVSFLLILLASGAWCIARRYRDQLGDGVYNLFGGDKPGKLPAYVALGAIFLAFVCCLAGFVQYYRDHSKHLHAVHHLEGEIGDLERELSTTVAKEGKEKLHEAIHEKHDAVAQQERAWHKTREQKWQGTLFTVARLRPAAVADPEMGTTLNIGFFIDSLSTVMFVMVTFIATLIHLFSMGYMAEEEQEMVEDHHVHGHHHHAVGEGHDDPVHGHHEGFKRRGRFGRFFMYLSLFCFSMLNLILADNLFQVFVSWELVGVCSFLLIGFYFERQSASDAANKAFITNRVGDAGFILGLLIIFGYIGTFNFEGSSRASASLPRRPQRACPGAARSSAATSSASRDQYGSRKLEATAPDDPNPGSEVFLFPQERPPARRRTGRPPRG